MPLTQLDDRRTRILRAIVREYIRSGEPVGSGSLAGRYRLNVSAATIRNDMAALEDLGFLVQPHTSAGRIPTDSGYRFYVDTLGNLPRLPEAQRRAIVATLDDRAADVEDLMRRTAHVLAEMTNYAAVALPPVVERGGMVRADLVPLGTGALLLVVTDTGRVDRRALELPGLSDAVDRVSRVLAERFGGLTYGKARDRARAMALEAAEGDREVLAAVAEAFADLERDPHDEHVFIGGVGNIAGEEAFEQRETLRRLFDALDEEATILRFLHRLAAEADDLAVRIGRENRLAAMSEASVVIARYRVGASPVGAIAVIGPTRMEYGSAMAAALAVARRLSDVVHPFAG